MAFFLPSEVAFILEAFGTGEELGIHDRCAEGGADRLHRFGHRLEEGAAGILHQMPTVGDLDRVGRCPCCCFAIATTSLAGDHANAGMGSEPRGDGRDLAVGQQLHDPVPFQIADDRAVAMVAAERPVIDADHGQGIGPAARPAPHDTQQRVVADRQHQPFGEDGTRPAAENETEVMDDPLHASGAARALWQRCSKTLGEDPLSAGRITASEAMCNEADLNRMTA